MSDHLTPEALDPWEARVDPDGGIAIAADGFSFDEEERECDVQFIAAANPATILAMSEYAINITRIDQGVNMGNHMQDMLKAVAPDPDETLGSLVERTLVQVEWDGSRTAAEDRYLTIRIAAKPKAADHA